MGSRMEIVLAVVAGALLIWLLAALDARRGLRSIERQGLGISQGETFIFAPGMRIMGALLIPASLGLMMGFTWLIPEDNIKPGDWLLAFILSAAVAGFGTVTGLGLAMGRIRVFDSGIIGWSAFTCPRFIAWNEVRAVKFSGVMQSYKLIGQDISVHVPVTLKDFPRLQARLREQLDWQRIYAGPLLAEDSASREELLQRSYYHSLCDHAPKAVSYLAVVVAITFLLVPVSIEAVFFSVIAGLFLTAATGLPMDIWPRLSGGVRTVIQVLGLAGFGFFSNMAWNGQQAHLGGDTVLDGYAALIILVQQLGLALWGMFLLLWLIPARRSH